MKKGLFSKFNAAYAKIIKEGIINADAPAKKAICIELPMIDEDDDGVVFYDKEDNPYKISEKQYDRWCKIESFIEDSCETVQEDGREIHYYFVYDQLDDAKKETLSSILNKTIPAMGETVVSFMTDGEYDQITDDEIEEFADKYQTTYDFD